MGQEKWVKRGGEKGMGKCSCVTFKPKHYLEILIFVHGQTSEADILHLEQRGPWSAWLTYRVLGSIGSLWPDSWLKMAQLASKGIFWHNSLKLTVNIQRGEIFIKNEISWQDRKTWIGRSWSESSQILRVHYYYYLFCFNHRFLIFWLPVTGIKWSHISLSFFCICRSPW